MRFNLRMIGTIAVLAILLIAPSVAASSGPVLVVADYKIVPGASVTATEPGPLMPGDTGTVLVTVTNTVKQPAQGNTTTVSDTLTYYTTSTPTGQTSPGRSTTTTTTTSDAATGCTAMKFVNLIGAGPVKVTNDPYTDPGCLGMGDSARFEFSIKVDEGASDGKYYLPFKVKTDNDNVFVNMMVPVVVDSSPVRMVVNDAPSSLASAKNSIVLDVVNYRPNGVTSVSVVPAGDEFVFKPRQEYTVGNIGPGEMYTVTFDITSKNGGYNGSPSFVVKYKNGDNWHESAPATVHLDAKDAVAAGTAAADSSSLLYLGGAIAVLVALVGGIFLYMRGQRAKK